jgi:hypothetical protein
MKLFSKKRKFNYYWVTYCYSKGIDRGTGSAEVSIGPRKIKTYHDIELICKHINDEYLNGTATIVIVNYIYMRTERKENKDE